VLIDPQTELLQQAQSARNIGNWTAVIQCLQQLLLDTRLERDRLLDLAIDALISGDFQQRWDVAKLFPKLAVGNVEGVIAPLIEIVRDEEEDEELRWYAARILGEFNQPRAISTLIELLKTADNDELTAMAATALGQIGNSAIAALSELLADEETRLLAVRSLAHIRRSEIITPLLSVVKDPDATIRAVAIEALSSFHNADIPPVLLQALDDIAANVRREAVIGLGFRSDLRDELDLVNKLVPKLYDFNIGVCCAAASALGRLGTDTAAKGLYQVLQSPHTPLNLQLECIRALGRVSTISSLQYLDNCLHEQSLLTLWQEIVKVLGQVEQLNLTLAAAQILIEALKSPQIANLPESIKGAIALSLGFLGDIRAIDPLIALLATSDSSVRLHVIAALQQVAPVKALQQLQQLNDDTTITPQLKQGIAIALAEWSPLR